MFTELMEKAAHTAAQAEPGPGTGLDELFESLSRTAPLVSAVIPTRGRPDLARRAIRSALAQSLEPLEVIVVIDGPDAESRNALGRIRDPRLRILQLSENVGGSEARNIGVRFARGLWIALLDDDDEWLPDKLAKQWELARTLESRYVLVASRFIERSEQADRVLPLRMPESGEHVSEYLFVRRGWRSGEGFLQTSTWFASRPLMMRVPFTRGLRRCQDLDWLLHAAALPDVEVRVAPEILAVFHHEDRRERVSRTADWRFLFSWASANRSCFTPRAFSFFVATFCVPSAAKQHEGWRSLLFLLRNCVSRGNASAKCLLLFLICWYMPESRRRSLRAWYDALPALAERKLPVSARLNTQRKAAS